MNLDQVRDETPGVEHRIHLNNAGAGLMPRPVIDAIKNHVDLESQIGGYEAAAERTAEIEQTYDSVAKLINTASENIAICENATAAYALVLSSLNFREGDLILTTDDDYVSNQLMFLSLSQRTKVEIVRAPCLSTGGADVGAMIEIMDQRRPTLVAVTHIPTNSGLIQPVAEIGRACREREIWYLVDGCQSIGQVPVDVQSIGCDFYTASFRKFLRGPRGIGFMYASDRVLHSNLAPLFPDLRSADWTDANLFQIQKTAKRFENWEFPYALVLGAGASVAYASELGVENCSRRALNLAAILRQSLLKFDQRVRVLDEGKSLGAIVTLGLPGHAADTVKAALESERINTSISLRGFAVIDFDKKDVDWALRVSPHYYNTESEIETFINVVQEIVSPISQRH
ncbi:MAG: aminotransferase class V-fold PLP-dependent enzyme [Pirellulaceae bacterium]